MYKEERKLEPLGFVPGKHIPLMIHV